MLSGCAARQGSATPIASNALNAFVHMPIAAPSSRSTWLLSRTTAGTPTCHRPGPPERSALQQNYCWLQELLNTQKLSWLDLVQGGSGCKPTDARANDNNPVLLWCVYLWQSKQPFQYASATVTTVQYLT